MDLFKSNIKKGVGEGNFGYGKYKKDGSGLDFTYQTKKKLQKEKDDFMKGKNKFGPEPTNYSNIMANILEKANDKLDKFNDKMAYKLDMVRPSKAKEMEEGDSSFGLSGFKNKGEYKEKKVKDVIYSIKKHNNPDKNEELVQLYQARKKYLSIANKEMRINTKFNSFDKLVKMIFDEYVEIYYYSTTQKKYCKVVIEPDTNKIVSMKITNNKSVNFSLSNDTHLNSQLNNLFSLLEQVERTDDISKSNVLKLKVSLDNFFNSYSTDTQIEEVQNELRDEYNTFVEENFEQKIDNDIIFIYNKFKIIIQKIQNSLENKRTNFSLINKNFNNMRNFNMSRNEMIDFTQRMKEIRMSHNFSNDITKQHELFDVINELFTFSEGKISGTEYKIKQLVSKLPSDKKDKGKEKLNSLVDSLKKKGLKEKEIISRLDAKADKLDRLVAFSKKSKEENALQKFDKLDKWTKIPLAVGGTILGANAINAIASPFAAKHLAEGFNGMTNAINQTVPQQQPQQSFLGSIFGKDGREVEEENFSKKSKKAVEKLKKAATLGAVGAAGTAVAAPYVSTTLSLAKTGRAIMDDEKVASGEMTPSERIKELKDTEEYNKDLVEYNKKDLSVKTDADLKNLVKSHAKEKEMDNALKQLGEDAPWYLRWGSKAMRLGNKATGETSRFLSRFGNLFGGSEEDKKQKTVSPYTKAYRKAGNVLTTPRPEPVKNTSDATTKTPENATNDGVDSTNTDSQIQQPVQGWLPNMNTIGINPYMAGGFNPNFPFSYQLPMNNQSPIKIDPSTAKMENPNATDGTNGSHVNTNTTAPNAKDDTTFTPSDMADVRNTISSYTSTNDNNSSSVDDSVVEDVVEYFYSNKWKLF